MSQPIEVTRDRSAKQNSHQKNEHKNKNCGQKIERQKNTHLITGDCFVHQNSNNLDAQMPSYSKDPKLKQAALKQGKL